MTRGVCKSAIAPGAGRAGAASWLSRLHWLCIVTSWRARIGFKSIIAVTAHASKEHTCRFI